MGGRGDLGGSSKKGLQTKLWVLGRWKTAAARMVAVPAMLSRLPNWQLRHKLLKSFPPAARRL